MAKINPLKLLKGAAKIIGGALGIDVAGALEAFDSDDLSPELQVQLQQYELSLRQLARDELKDEIDAKVDLMKTEIESGDPFVRRARPTGLYISYLVSLGLAAALIFGVDLDPAAVLTLIGPLMGFSGWYTYNRTQEKKVGMA